VGTRQVATRRVQAQGKGVAGGSDHTDGHGSAGLLEEGGEGDQVGGGDDVVGSGHQHRVVAVAQEAEAGGVDQAAAGAEQDRLDHHLDPGPAGEAGDQLVGAVVGVDHDPGRPGRLERLDGQLHQRPAGRGEQRLGDGPGQRPQSRPCPRRQAEPDHRGTMSGPMAGQNPITAWRDVPSSKRRSTVSRGRGRRPGW
jgi:hypothetical protein